MKKVLAILMAMVLISGVAFAATIQPIDSVDMAAELAGKYFVDIKMENVTDAGMVVDIYEAQAYDAAEVEKLAVGDVVVLNGEEVTVESIEIEYSTLINGGDEEGGVTLCPEEDGKSYVALNFESPIFMLCGQAELPFADEVSYAHWTEDEEGNVMLAEEAGFQTIPAAQIKDQLAQDELYGMPSITVEDGKIVELVIEYTP